jgi:hypothetical protein
MTRQAVKGSTTFMLVGFLTMILGGCGKEAAPASVEPPTAMPEAAANRGTFGETACPKKDRIEVSANAAFAVYFDNDGNELDGPAEILRGTQSDKMCPIYPPPDALDPGACTPLCPKVINKKTYCIPCS